MKRTGRVTFERIVVLDDGIRFFYDVDGREASFSTRYRQRPSCPADYLHLVGIQIGLAYLVDIVSLTLPESVVVKPILLDEPALDFWRETARNIALELVYARQWDISLSEAVWTCDSETALVPFAFPDNDRLLLGIGGGKESLAAVKIFRETRDLALLFLYYREEKDIYYRNAFDFLSQRFAYVRADTDIFDIARLGETHAERDDYGSFIMGHILFNALLFGDRYRYLALGNEYSSNFSNAVYRGQTINHQYDKTVEFAQTINRYINTYVHKDFHYFSPFFGLYEYKICQIFLSDADYLDIWTSCNNIFDKENFCCACHKCAFTYMLCLTFMDEARLNEIFTRDILNNLALCLPLVAFDGAKPLDCVGEKEEVWLALHASRRQGKGRDTAVMNYFTREILPNVEGRMAEIEENLLREQFGFRYIPHPFRDAVIRACGRHRAGPLV